MGVEIHEDQPIVEAPVYTPEGVYATYNYVWSREYGGAVWLDGIFVDDAGTIYATDESWPNSYVRTFAGVETNTLNYRFTWVRAGSEQFAQSSTGQYVLGLEDVAGLVEAWRNGAMIWSRNIALDDADFANMEVMKISPSGEFIAIIANSVLTGWDSLVLLYQGA